MPLSRRDFCQLLGTSAAGSALAERGRFRPSTSGPIRLDSNENPWGPSPAARDAMLRALADGARYPESAPLVAAIATANGVQEGNVLLTVGATEGLGLAARAFTGSTRPLVTAAPSYGAIATATEQLGHPVIRVPVGPDGGLDLGAMVSRAQGAGVLYLCNPNNPSGTLLPGAAIPGALAELERSSPGTAVVVGEAYHEYVVAPAYRSAVPEAVRRPGVLVNRTFSKLYALAGLRLGYLVGHEETIRRLATLRVPIGASSLAVAAGLAVLADTPERERQRALNAATRRWAEAFVTGRGWRACEAHANYLFIETGRPIGELRAACQARGLLIGRFYPPAETWARVTIGTPDETRAGFGILDAVLREKR